MASLFRLEDSSSKIIQLNKVVFEDTNGYLAFLCESYFFLFSNSRVMNVYSINFNDQGQFLKIFIKNQSVSCNIKKLIYNNKLQHFVLIADAKVSILHFNAEQKTILQYKQVSNLKKFQNPHNKKIKGILFDTKFDRLITYSDDGFFKIWDKLDSENSKFKLMNEENSRNCSLLDACSISIINVLVLS